IAFLEALNEESGHPVLPGRLELFKVTNHRRGSRMTALSQSTRRKLSLLQLAQELKNVSKACQIMGYHRDTFYEIRRAFQVGGVNALVEQKRGPKSPPANRVAPEIEADILQYALDHPTYGPQRVANELRLKGRQVSSGGVRNVWLRHDLETRFK